jgi:hypothetical protein
MRYSNENIFLKSKSDFSIAGINKFFIYSIDYFANKYTTVAGMI